MLNPTFHHVAAGYIRSLVKQRRYLQKAGLSKSNPGLTAGSLDTLEKYMGAYSWDTDLKMALFWTKHSSDIYALIPGSRSGYHRKAILLFQLLSCKAESLLMGSPQRPRQESLHAFN